MCVRSGQESADGGRHKSAGVAATPTNMLPQHSWPSSTHTHRGQPPTCVGRHRDADRLYEELVPTQVTDFTLYASHPMSTCRMGINPETSVISPNGNTHGIDGLYIADASVFPTSLGVNPQLTTLTVGTAIGRRMLNA